MTQEHGENNYSEERVEFGETGLISPIETLSRELSSYGFYVTGIPLGGTFGQVQNKGAWVSELPGAFDSGKLAEFDGRRVEYDPIDLDMVEMPPAPLSIYAELLLDKNGGGMTPLELQDPATRQLILSRGLLRGYLYPQTLRSGEHELGLVAADQLGAFHYSDLLVHELTSGKYPRGVRLDSSEYVDERSMAIFSAVNCGVVFPKIFKEAHFILEGHEDINGLSMHNIERLKGVFQKMVVLVSMGSDQKRIANSFFDIAGFYSGLTFVTISSNSSWGVKGGDAEDNLRDIETVVKAINSGKLPRGVAYDVGDGLVSTHLLQKMKPEAWDSQGAVLGKDGKYYGATFLAFHSMPISDLEKAAGWYFDQSLPQIRDLPIFLSYRPNPEEDGDYDPAEATEASQLMELFNAVQTISIDDVLPDKLPQGTRFIIIEGPGRANNPNYILGAAKNTVDQLEARTNDATRPVFIVASECTYPYATEEYGASTISGLKTIREYKDRVVSGRTLPAHAIRNLIAVTLMKTKVSSDFGFLEAERELLGVSAEQIQGWIDEYIKARNLTSIYQERERVSC